jgi:hypothetical protein
MIVFVERISFDAALNASKQESCFVGIQRRFSVLRRAVRRENTLSFQVDKYLVLRTSNYDICTHGLNVVACPVHLLNGLRLYYTRGCPLDSFG